MKRILDIKVGDEFGDLICIAINPPSKSTNNTTTYTMECKYCHRQKKMLSSTIRLKHGITHKACGKGLKTKDPVFYDRWQAMRTRTTNPNYQHYADYGGRGISSEAFKYFIDFYDAMYPSFKALADKIGSNNVSLERMDVNRDYTPQNCIWIPLVEQHCNTRDIIRLAVQNKNNIEIVNLHKNLLGFCRENNLYYSSVKHYIATYGIYINDQFIIRKLYEPINLVQFSTDPIELVSYSKV